MFSLSKKDGKLSTLVWIVFTIFHFCPFNSKVDIYLPIYLTLERTKLLSLVLLIPVFIIIFSQDESIKLIIIAIINANILFFFILILYLFDKISSTTFNSSASLNLPTRLSLTIPSPSTTIVIG